MSHKYKFRDQSKLYFVTLVVINWIDVFTRQKYRDLFLDSIRYCQQHKGLELCAYCIMSNHVHMIIGRNGNVELQCLLRDIKKYTSVKIVTDILKNDRESRRLWMIELFERAGSKNASNTRFQFWQNGNHPMELYSNRIIDQKLDYIHQNPVRAGIVLSAEEYLYSSALNYCGRPEKLIEVILI